ncbi:MAG: UvrD-helicase domain-containing protein [Bryobacterales bacterium]|nr:UvrD-helicase domain-containing protein [Bryobacterales bacterium]
MTPSSAQTPPDAGQRARALDGGASFLVQAPAGSGKTELLIQRYLVLLALVERPEAVLAITFTRKAAGEMRARVLEALRSAREAEPREAHKRETWRLARAVWEHDRALGWDLLDNPRRMRIQTIDSLCSWLAGRLPVLGGLGGSASPVENAEEAYEEAAADAIRMLSSNGPLADDVRELLLHRDNDAGRLTALITMMLRKRDQWLPRIGLAGDVEELRPVLEESLDAAVRYEMSLATRSMPAVEAAPRTLAEWKDLAGRLLTKTDGEPRKRLPGVWKDMELPPGFVYALRRVRSAPEPRFEEHAWRVLAAALRLLRHAVGELRLRFLARGEVDFNELSLAALRALGGSGRPTDLALALGERIEHLLVDEMQDTSVTHLELLRRLTAGWAGLHEERPRTVFLVGDPMQSIYLFREAEVGNFLDLRANGLGELKLEPLTLMANFRSQSGIVEWVNRTFPGVLAAIEDVATGAIPYTAAVATREKAEGDAVTVHPFEKGDNAGEAECVASIVEEALREGAGTVAVLARRRADLTHILEEFQRRGIGFRAVDLDPLAERPVVLDLISLVRALLHPMDRVSWLAVLRAPWCGMRLADLNALVDGQRGKAVRTLLEMRGGELSEDGRARWERIREALDAGLERVRRERLRVVVEETWRSLGGPECIEAARDARDADVLLGLLDRLEKGGEVDFAVLGSEVGRLYAAPDPRGDARVQVMTIHKSKGLEFDVVIVPGLDKTKRPVETELIRMVRLPLEGEDRVLMAAVAPVGKQEEAGQYLGAYLAEREKNELRRLLYVASTRAKQKLHLLGQVKWDAVRREWKTPRAGSMLHALWGTVGWEFQAMPEPVAEEGGAEATRVYPLLRRVEAGWRTPARDPALRWREETIEDEAERHTYDWVSETARHVGVAVHAWLMKIAGDGVERWDAERVMAREGAIRAQLAALGVPPDELAGATERTQRALSSALSDERGRWVLTRHAEDRREFGVTVAEGGGVRAYRVDCTFVDAQGRRWVIDFKTSVHEGAGVEEFLDEEQRRYRGQLERYARVLQSGEEAVRLGLYFPLLGAWREWEAPGAAYALKKVP